jgi:hypothetical protein
MTGIWQISVLHVARSAILPRKRLPCANHDA